MTDSGEQQVTADAGTAEQSAASSGIKLRGLFLKKVGMTSVYGDAGEMIPVTVLKMEPWVVTQLKTTEKDGYQAVQIASGPKKAVRTSNAERGHLKKAGFENGAQYIREIRQELAGDMKVGSQVTIDTFAKGDVVKVTSTSKGKGFAGSVRRYGFAGGPASHGSKFHRQPGSSGNRTWPGRVMPGKRFPGHLGADTVTVNNVKVVDVLHDENVILVKGPVPGARNSLVKLVKE
ncbi:MAG: 50S ribosomal protein L3 [Deltaproteobacteria bacterium]|jgi:large subunit ribosomal protein L3|nr:50S ribosomal protein L3 [Deltaproteobacteria bacterium]MDZ4082639.1 50S ribosomal protein L3 [Bdellovibrionales bacterium]